MQRKNGKFCSRMAPAPIICSVRDESCISNSGTAHDRREAQGEVQLSASVEKELNIAGGRGCY